ncbi:MAG TPA: DUF2804 domain-containing protein [Candidatus Mediterraneibacter merdipullorum]|nr:DUF2804 domain-containing protein [Candidatus Mediterraneibacter merdipullorum]
MRNHEVTTEQDLLDAAGKISEPGWARRPVWRYDRTRIQSPAFRIKEWDYYLVMNGEYGAAFTLSDDGYIGLQSVSLLNFRERWEHTETVLTPFPMGKMKMPASSGEGTVTYRDKRLRLSFRVEGSRRMISCDFRDFWQGKPLYCEIALDQPKMDTMTIATPWGRGKAFYYNQKVNCMPAEGYLSFDEKTCWFSPEKDYGTLDWGRGVWTYDNTWYWSSGNGTVGGKPFGFNLGYGFGDTSAATENILFYEGKGHKLDDVTFHIPADDYMKPWRFTSSDGRFEMEFEPVLDRSASMSALVVSSDQHQVFGKMSGRAVLDDGRFIELKDFLCFAEKVHNRY